MSQSIFPDIASSPPPSSSQDSDLLQHESRVPPPVGLKVDPSGN